MYVHLFMSVREHTWLTFSFFTRVLILRTSHQTEFFLTKNYDPINNLGYTTAEAKDLLKINMNAPSTDYRTSNLYLRPIIIDTMNVGVS